MVNNTSTDTPYRALVVDDEPAVLAIVAEILSKAGFQVSTHVSGESALEELSPQTFDVLITDVCMDGMSGFELIHCADQIDPTLRSVVMTGHDSYEMLQTALRAGAHDYLAKPIKDHQLVVLTAERTAQAVRLVRCNDQLLEQLRENHSMLERANHRLRELNEALRIQANTDSLTELYNRRYIDKSLSNEVARRNRYHDPLSVVLIDVDHFKRFNDRYGHKGGDMALQTIAETLTSCARNTDIVGRYGGEEFLFILPKTNPADAMLFAERVRTVIAQKCINLGDSHAQVTASIGVAGVDEHFKNVDVTSLVCAADAALYAAKAAGRDLVCQESLNAETNVQWLKAG